MEEIKKMLFKYEFWFKVKQARNSRKNKKDQKANSSFGFLQKFEQDKYILLILNELLNYDTTSNNT